MKYFNVKLPLTTILASVIIFAASISFAAVTQESDILFCESDGVKLLGDMYVPDGDGPFPGILFVHGGGFIGGDKAFTGQPEHLRSHTERGYVVFSINYRLLTEGAGFEKSIQDTKCGLAWMKANAEKYKVDKNNIAVMGFSAGGYFAAMIAFTQNIPEFQPVAVEFKDSDTSVVAAILFYPPMNFTTYKSSLSSMLDMQIRRLEGLKTAKEVEAYKRKYSPIFYIENPPPLFLAYTLNDGLVPPSQQEEFMAALDKAGAIYESFAATSENADHGFITRKPDLPDTIEATKRMFVFIDKYLKPSGK